MVASLMTSVHQSCIASAAAGVDITIRNTEGRVIIDGITIESTVRSSVRDCATASDKAAGPLFTEKLKEMLKNHLRETTATSRVSAVITNTVTAEVAQSCVAHANASFQLDVDGTQGTVYISGVTIQQTAIANIQKCLMSSKLTVGGTPLPEWLAAHESDFDLVGVPLVGDSAAPKSAAPLFSTTPMYAAAASVGMSILYVIVVALLVWARA